MMLGMLDRTFGSAGGVLVPVPGATASAVTTDPRGQVVIAGNVPRGDAAGNLIVLVRLAASGAVDPSFGSRGLVALSGSVGYSCRSLLADSDGTLLVAATSTGPVPGTHLIRLDARGDLVSAAGPDDLAVSLSVLAICDDGRIVAAGVAPKQSGAGPADLAIVRFLPNGALDTAFGRAGLITTDFAGRHFALSSLLVDGHRVLAVGTVSDRETAHTAILRYRDDGLLDGTFGGGLCIGSFGGDHSRALTGSLLPSGRIVIAGCARSPRGGDRPAYAGYHPDGALDTGFASEGRGPQHAPDLAGAFTSAAVDTAGRAVLAGRLARGQAAGVGLTRLTDNGQLDPAIGVGGVLHHHLDRIGWGDGRRHRAWRAGRCRGGHGRRGRPGRVAIRPTCCDRCGFGGRALPDPGRSRRPTPGARATDRLRPRHGQHDQPRDLHVVRSTTPKPKPEELR